MVITTGEWVLAIAGHTSTLGSSHALLSAVSTSQALLLLPNSPPTPHDISPLPHFSLARWILLMFGIAEICAPPPMTASLSGDELGVALRADAMLSNWSNTVFVKCPFRSGLRKCLGWPVDQAPEDCGSRFRFSQKSRHFVPSWGENPAISAKRMKFCGQKYCAQILVDYMVTYRPDFDQICNHLS